MKYGDAITCERLLLRAKELFDEPCGSTSTTRAKASGRTRTVPTRGG